MSNTATASIKDQNKSAASSLLKKNIRKFLRNKLAVLGLLIILVMTIACVAAMVLGVDYSTPNPTIMKAAPDAAHLFGTDTIGRDLLLKSKFRPEFLNRLDEIVYYKSLTKDEMRKIVDLQLADLRSRMDEGKHLNLDVTTAAKDYIIDSAYDSVYGARPIKRFIQSRVETLIAKAIIQGRYAEGSTLTVDYDGNALVLK